MKKPIQLILVRHGNTFEAGQVCNHVGAKTDLILTGEGKKQAKNVGDYLSSHGIIPRAIYAGKLKRQKETAEIIAATLKHKAPLHLNEPALNEVDYGQWEGLTTEEITERWPKEYSDWSENGAWPEGIFEETLKHRLHEIEAWINKLRKEYAPGDVVVGVTSNGIIRYFYSFVPDEWTNFVRNHNMGALKVKTGNLCEILLYEDKLQVKHWNTNPVLQGTVQSM